MTFSTPLTDWAFSLFNISPDHCSFLGDIGGINRKLSLVNKLIYLLTGLATLFD